MRADRLNSRRNPCAALTRVELLAVITVLTVLLGLAMPALTADNEAAHRNACQNNLKQIALTLLNYEDKRHCLPPISSNVDATADVPGDVGAAGDENPPRGPGSAASSAAGYSWVVFILPDMEEAMLYQSIVTTSKKFLIPAFSPTIAITTVTMPGSGKSATISNLGGTGINDAGVTMNGAGTLFLGGANTYTGPTTVTNGILRVNGTHVGSGNYSVSTGGTLGGTGTVTPAAASSIAIAGDGFLSPGASIGTFTIDSLTATGPVLTFASGATILDELNNSFLSDKVALVNGAAADIAFNGNVINFTDLSAGSLASGAYTLFTADVASAYSGLTTDGSGNITSGLAIGTGLSGYSASLQTVGNNIVVNINAVPEPGTLVLAMAGLTGLGLFRRRQSN